MSGRVLAGYAYCEGVLCPYCDGNYVAFEDDRPDSTTVAILCWCGAQSRVRRTNPVLVRHLAALR